MFFNLFKKKKENQKSAVSEPIKVETTPNPQPKVEEKEEVKQKKDGYYVALRLGYAWGFISPSTRLDTNDGFSNSLSNSTIGALSFDSLNEATQFVNKLFNTVLNRYGKKVIAQIIFANKNFNLLFLNSTMPNKKFAKIKKIQ